MMDAKPVGRKARTPARGQAMSENEDPEALARRFLDLWQEHVAASAADPAIAEAMQRLAVAGAAAPAAWMAMWTGAAARAQHGASHAAFPDAAAQHAPHGAAPAGAAPGGGGGGLDGLARRIDELERRVALLEQPGARAPRARKRPRAGKP
jgi:hypothetical protein